MKSMVILLVPDAALASLTANQSPVDGLDGGLTVRAAEEQSIRAMLYIEAVCVVVLRDVSRTVSRSLSVASRVVSADTVTVRVAPAVVVIPVPAAIVAVWPSLTVCEVPVLPASVQEVIPPLIES